jgi:hypothetical protein
MKKVYTTIKNGKEKNFTEDEIFEIICREAFIANTDVERFALIDFDCRSYTELYEKLQSLGHLTTEEGEMPYITGAFGEDQEVDERISMKYVIYNSVQDMKNLIETLF